MPRSEQGGSLKIRRKCFLVSTAEDLNSSELHICESDEKLKYEKTALCFIDCHMSHFAKIVIKKHPAYKKSGALFNRTIV